MMSQLHRMGASPAALSLAAQLFGVGPCPACGFRKLHCRCPVAPDSAASASIDTPEFNALMADYRAASPERGKPMYLQIVSYIDSRAPTPAAHPVGAVDEALTALDELADEAVANGNTKEPGAWLDTAVSKIRAALAQQSVDKAAPATWTQEMLDQVNREAEQMAAKFGKPRELADPAPAAQAVDAPTLPPVICVGRPFPTTDKATIHFARDVTDDELLAVNEALKSRLNRSTASPASAPEATSEHQAHVTPPTRGTGSQHDADHAVLTNDEIDAMYEPLMSKLPARYALRELARAVEVEVARRFRAQGGNTNNSNADLASQVSAHQAKESDHG
jgi:hypothetical protein